MSDISPTVPVPAYVPGEETDDLEEELLERQRHQRALDARLYDKLREIFLQFLHLALLALICWDNRTDDFYWQNKTMKDLISLQLPGKNDVTIITFNSYYYYHHHYYYYYYQYYYY